MGYSMSEKLQNEFGILPHSFSRKALKLSGSKGFMGLLMFSLAGCSTVSLQVQQPQMPSNVEQARAYMASREQQLIGLEYELNQQERACYERFFVADCLDRLRLQRAAYRRAHVLAQDRAQDLIREQDYAKRKRETSETRQ